MADIEQLVAQVGVLRSVFALRVHQERLGKIGIAVFLDVLLVGAQLHERTCTGSTCAGANFQYAQSQLRVLLAPPLDIRDQDVSQHVVEIISNQVIFIDALYQPQRRLREHGIGRRSLQPQYLGQGPQHGLDQYYLCTPVLVRHPRRFLPIPFSPCRTGIVASHSNCVGIDPTLSTQHHQAFVEPAVVQRWQGRAHLVCGLTGEQANFPQLDEQQACQLIVHLAHLCANPFAYARHPLFLWPDHRGEFSQARRQE